MNQVHFPYQPTVSLLSIILFVIFCPSKCPFLTLNPIDCFQDNTLHLQIICKRPFQMKFSFSLFVPMPPQPQPAIVITTLVRAASSVARRVIKLAGTMTIAVPRSRCKALIVVVMPRMEDQSIRAKTARPWRRRVMRISTSS